MTKTIIRAVVLLLSCQFSFAAWTATPASKKIENGKLVVFMNYTNGPNTFTRYHVVDTYAQFVSEVRAEVARLDGVDLALPQVTLGSAVNVTVAPPTQAELDRAAFAVLVQDWLDKKKAVDNGLSKTLTQVDVDAAYAAVKNAFKIEYAGMIPMGL